MIASDETAIVPVVPLATMLAATLPGASAANTPCIMFDSALIGPQLVSPSTRRPTSMSGSDRRIAATVIHTGIASIVDCTMHSATAQITAPVAMNFSGSSLEPIRAVRRLRNVSTRIRQRSPSAVSPPATSMPVAGHIIGTRPRNLTIMQLIAVPVGAAAVSWMYPALVNTFGIVDKPGPNGTVITAQLTSPISNKWSGFAQILKEGVGALPTSALYALLIFSILGCAFTVLETTKWKKYVPSPTGVGIGILVPFAVVSTMFVGGLVGWFWEKKHKQSADVLMVPLASGFIAGEALVAVFASIYLAAVG